MKCACVVLILLQIRFASSAATPGRCQCVPQHLCRQNNEMPIDGIVDISAATPGRCQCVPQHLCRQNNEMPIDGIVDIRFEKSTCKNYFEVCCETPVNKEDWTKPITSPPNRGCGYQNLDALGMTARITDDSTQSSFGELPWSVIILYRESETDRNTYKCGGSLIHYQVVLTAAHCVYGLQNVQWTVRAGEWDNARQDEPHPHQDRLVREIAVHSHYQSRSLKNDIALLFLAEPLKQKANIGFICLPAPGTALHGTRCIASGWGKNASRRGRHSSVLKKVELPIVSPDLCLEHLRGTRLGKFYNLHQSFICAGGEHNKDTCKGDGGSPLVCPLPGHGGRYVQMGIVSWGIGCGESKTPGVYVNVALYRDWVDEQLTLRSINTKLYRYD